MNQLLPACAGFERRHFDAPTPPKEDPTHKAVGGLNTEHPVTTCDAHAGHFWNAEQDWVAGGRASALTPPALHAPVAQTVEHPPCERAVAGATPAAGSMLGTVRGAGHAPSGVYTHVRAVRLASALALYGWQSRFPAVGQDLGPENSFDVGEEASVIVLAVSVRHNQPANVNRERQLGTRSRPRGVNGVGCARRSSSAPGVSTRAGLQRARVGAVVEIRCGGGGAVPGAGLSRLETDYARERADESMLAEPGAVPGGSTTSNPNEVLREQHERAGRPAPVSEGLTDSSVPQKRAEQPAQLRRAA
jgi:hypothetical protein